MTLSRGFYTFTPAKGSGWRWPNFSPAELACKCETCGHSYFHDPDFLDGLQRVRNRVGGLHINSGFRCAIHNHSPEVGGAEKSQHLIIAADISLANHPDRWKLKVIFKEEGFRGIGHGSSFIHVDRRSEPAEWYYGTESVKAWARSA